MLHIIYLHGLNSNHNAYKARLLRDYCQQHFPDVQVHCPDLNAPPKQVLALLCQQIDELSPHKVALVGSSLGGFFATLLHQRYACRTVLLNPSLFPEQSLNRFAQGSLDDYQHDDILYTTQGGWQIRKADLDWFMTHRPQQIAHAETLWLILKQGDDVLDYRHSLNYFHQASNANPLILLEPYGDHVMSDFADKLPEIVYFLTMGKK